MVVGRLTPVQEFVVYNPRWRDRVALIAKYKVGNHNVITFPKAKSLPGKWYISGDDARKCNVFQLKTKAGTTMDCYEVPLDALQPFERSE